MPAGSVTINHEPTWAIVRVEHTSLNTNQNCIEILRKSRIQLFVTLVDGQKLLTNVTKTFILDAAGVLDMPLLTDYCFEVLFSSFRVSNFVQHKSSLRAYFMHARHHTRNLSSPGKFSINAKFPIFIFPCHCFPLHFCYFTCILSSEV